MGKVLIIAEAGVNHNGSLELAKRLIDVAAEAGVDSRLSRRKISLQGELVRLGINKETWETCPNLNCRC